jgi:hypothetical protein
MDSENRFHSKFLYPLVRIHNHLRLGHNNLICKLQVQVANISILNQHMVREFVGYFLEIIYAIKPLFAN